jgi:solute carrier family 13 (sodium-dependent dicarboxylate transporter), member 2/3/5
MTESKNSSDAHASMPKPSRRARILNIMRPRIFSRMHRLLRFMGRFSIVLALTGGTLLLPTPAGLSPEGQRAVAAFVFTASILALEPVSLPIAALMVPVAEVALGVATAPQAFETFSRPVVFLILASLFLAEALRKHGLTRRLAFSVIVASGFLAAIGPWSFIDWMKYGLAGLSP